MTYWRWGMAWSWFTGSLPNQWRGWGWDRRVAVDAVIGRLRPTVLDAFWVFVWVVFLCRSFFLFPWVRFLSTSPLDVPKLSSSMYWITLRIKNNIGDNHFWNIILLYISNRGSEFRFTKSLNDFSKLEAAHYKIWSIYSDVLYLYYYCLRLSISFSLWWNYYLSLFSLILFLFY